MKQRQNWKHGGHAFKNENKMKKPPLYKAETPLDVEVIGYYEIDGGLHFIRCKDTREPKLIELRTLQIQCSDGEFRPIGEVEVVTIIKQNQTQNEYESVKIPTLIECECGKLKLLGTKCKDSLNGECEI